MLLLAPVDIQEVADEGQGVVGQTQGDDDLPDGDRAALAQVHQQAADGFHQHGAVFAVAVEHQQDDDAEGGQAAAALPVALLDGGLFLPVFQAAEGVIHVVINLPHLPAAQPDEEGGEEQEEQLFPTGERVEHQAERQQDVAPRGEGGGVAFGQKMLPGRQDVPGAAASGGQAEGQDRQR